MFDIQALTSHVYMSKPSNRIWDEFRAVDYETGEIKANIADNTKIFFNESWSPALKNLHDQSKGMKLRGISANSTNDAQFDLKANTTLPTSGAYTSRYLIARCVGEICW